LELYYSPAPPLPDPLPPEPPLPLLFVLVLLLSVVEPLPELLLPVPLVVPEPVPEPEPLTLPEPLPLPEPLVVPVDVGDDDLSEQPDNPRPRLNDMTAAVNRYFWFRIAPPFIDLQPLRSPREQQPICHSVGLWPFNIYSRKIAYAWSW
jgi:hypothetical protein